MESKPPLRQNYFIFMEKNQEKVLYNNKVQFTNSTPPKLKTAPIAQLVECPLPSGRSWVRPVTYIRVTRHSIFQPHRYVGADIT